VFLGSRSGLFINGPKNELFWKKLSKKLDTYSNTKSIEFFGALFSKKRIDELDAPPIIYTFEPRLFSKSGLKR
jgi:hypothetical protein